MSFSNAALNEWNPLEEDYNDLNSNSYDSGAGANLPSYMQPANYRNDESNSYVLWVRPLSARYTQESLKNIFSSYGEVTDVHIVFPKGDDRSPFGYVSYKTQSAATEAIRRFNDDNKFEFKVNYAKEESVQRMRNNRNDRNPTGRYRSNNVNMTTTNRGSDEVKQRGNNSTQNTSRDSCVGFSSPITSASTTLSKPESTNSASLGTSVLDAKIIRAKKANMESDKARVAKSSWVTPFHCCHCQKSTFMTCKECDEKFCDAQCSLNGWKHHRANCVQVAELIYCDATKPAPQLASENDSPRTQYREFRTLAEDYRASSGIGDNDSSSTSSLSCGTIAAVPRAAAQFNAVCDNNYDDNVDGAIREITDNVRPKSRRFVKESCDDHERRAARNYSSDASRDERVGFQRTKCGYNDQRRQTSDNSGASSTRITAQSRIDGKRINEEFIPQANSSLNDDKNSRKMSERDNMKKLEMDRETDVVIASTDPSSELCYVRIVDNEEIFNSMVRSLNDHKSLVPLEMLKSKTKCVAKYKNKWHRGLVVCEQPVRVRFIDYGVTQEIMDVQDIRRCPEKYTALSPFAYKVTIQSVPCDQVSEWQADNRVITIKPRMRNADNSFAVDVMVDRSFDEKLAEARLERERGNASSTRIASGAKDAAVSSVTVSTPPAADVAHEAKQVGERDSNSPLSSNDMLKFGRPSRMYVTYVDANDDRVFFVAPIESFIKLNSDMNHVDFESLPRLSKARQGDVAMAFYADLCCRVEITNVDPLTVCYLDYGNSEKYDAENLKILPTEYAKIPPLAIRVKLVTGTRSDNNVIENSEVVVTPVKMNDDSWLVCVGEVTKDECARLAEQATSICEPAVGAKPTVTMDVYITYSVSKSEAYGIRKTDVDAFQLLNQRLASNTYESIGATATVQLDEVYAKQFEGMWCRATVVNVNPLTVYFADYGNTEISQVEELYRLPGDLCREPQPLAIKMKFERGSSHMLEYGMWVSVLWDMNTDTYVLTRDPTIAANAVDSDSVAVSNNSAAGLVNVVTALGNSTYAVILEENRNVYKYINRVIYSNLDRLVKLHDIKINRPCLAIYEDENWHRASIISLSPLSVYFLDFANVMNCQFTQLKEMPANLLKIPPLAFKIRTEDYVTLREGSEVKVSLIEEIDHNYWKVSTIKEKERVSQNSCKRLEIVADPQHIEKILKKKAAKKLIPFVKQLPQPEPEPTRRWVDDEDSGSADDVKFVAEYKRNVDIGERTRIPMEATPPKNYAKNSNSLPSLSKGVLRRNRTFSDSKVPIDGHLLDLLTEGDRCVFIVHDSLSDVEYTGMLLCKRTQHVIDVIDQIEDTVDTSANDYTAKQGDLVAAFVEGVNSWYRGYVMYEPSVVDPFYVLFLFDMGIVHRTDKVYRLSEHLSGAPQLAVRLKVTQFANVPDEVSRLEVVPMNVNLFEGDTYQHDKSIYQLDLTKEIGTEYRFDGKLMSQFNNEHKPVHEVQLTAWSPTREEIGVKNVSIMDGDCVKISAVWNTNHYFVIPVDEELNEQRNDFLSKIALHCLKDDDVATPSSDEPLKLKQIVAVPYMKSYYRAQIVEVRKQSYMARVLDVGTQVKVLKQDVKMLPDDLKFENCFAVCIQLHDVSPTDFNQISEQFLKYIVTHECEFNMKVNKSSNLIELIFAHDVEKLDIKKGINFNQRLNKMLTPTWKIERLNFGDQFFFTHLKFEEWEIGSELSLAFVECVNNDSGTMINRYGDVYSKLSEVNLDERLKEYAEEKYQPYVPIRKELCVAKFGDKWYRAYCLHADPGKDLEIQFVDIGFRRRLSHKEIRPMHSDFLRHPAAAMFCRVRNYLDCNSLAALEGKVLKRCKVLEKIEEGGYAIYVENLSAYACNK